MHEAITRNMVFWPKEIRVQAIISNVLNSTLLWVSDTKSFFGNDYITKSVLACPSLLAIQALKRFMNLVLLPVASFFLLF